MSYESSTLFTNLKSPDPGIGAMGTSSGVAVNTNGISMRPNSQHRTPTPHPISHSSSDDMENDGDISMADQDADNTLNTILTTPDTDSHLVKKIQVRPLPAGIPAPVFSTPTTPPPVAVSVYGLGLGGGLAPAATTAAAANLLTTNIPGTPYPPQNYNLEIPWSKVWSAQTLKSKSNQTKMKHFLRMNALPSTAYSSLKGDALTALVRNRQGLNELAYKKAAEEAAKAAKEKKRLLFPGGDDDNDGSDADNADNEGKDKSSGHKKTKAKTTNGAGIGPSTTGRPRNISSNLTLVTAGMTICKKMARKDVRKYIETNGYEWDDDGDASPYPSGTNDEDDEDDDEDEADSDIELTDDTFDTSKRFTKQTMLFDKTSHKPVLAGEAQFRIREALFHKYGTRTLRQESHVFSAGQLKIARKAMRSARKNYRKLVHAVATSIRGSEHKQKTKLAEELIRAVLGKDIDGQFDERGQPLDMEHVDMGGEGEGATEVGDGEGQDGEDTTREEEDKSDDDGLESEDGAGEDEGAGDELSSDEGEIEE